MARLESTQMSPNTFPPVAASLSPFIIEFVMVHCYGMKFMAYQDEAGQWRTAYEHRLLPEPVEVLW